MKRYSKFRTTQFIMIVLSSLWVCFSANSAIYEMDEENWHEDLIANQNNLTPGGTILDQLQLGDLIEPEEQIKDNYLLVVGLIKEKKFSEAKKKLSLLIAQDATQPAYYNLKALLHIIENDPSSAEQSFQKTITLNNRNEQAYIGLAKLALDKKHFDQARQYADKALEINSNAINAYYVLADLSMQQQGIDASEKVLTQALLTVKGNLKAELNILTLLGKVYVTKNQPEKLLQLANDLVKRNQGDVTALSYLASVQLFNQDLTGAEQSLRQIISQEANNTQHRFFLARLLSEHKDKESEVLKLLDETAQKLENPTTILAFKSEFLTRQKKYEAAFSIAEQIDELYPDSSVGKLLKGNIYFAEKKYDDALENFEAAYHISQNIKILEAMLKTLTLQNKPKAAVEILEKEFAKNTANDQIQFKLAGAYQDSAQYDLSINHYEALLVKNEDNIIILNNLAWAYSQEGNKKALPLAKKAYNKEPKSPIIADTYGYILLKNGQKQDGLEILKKAALLDPNMEEIQLHLAEAYIANDNKSEAKKILKQILSKDGNKKIEASKLMEQL